MSLADQYFVAIDEVRADDRALGRLEAQITADARLDEPERNPLIRRIALYRGDNLRQRDARRVGLDLDAPLLP